jgi:hypothetical protein
LAYCNERLKVIHQDCERFGMESDLNYDVAEDTILTVVKKDEDVVESDVKEVIDVKTDMKIGRRRRIGYVVTETNTLSYTKTD